MPLAEPAMRLSVRALEAGDRGPWHRLWQGYLEFYGVALADTVTDSAWGRLLDQACDMHGLCAVTGPGEMVGFAHYLFHPVTWSINPRCCLEDLYVAEKARGMGAGRALIEAVYAAADAREADQVYWLTQDFNATARRLYDRVGRLTPFVKYQR